MGRWAVMGVVGCVAIAGCSDGGSSSGGEAPPPFPPEARSFEALDTEGVMIADERAALSYTDPSSLPTSGGANYTGVMGLVLSPEPRPDTPAELDGMVLLGDMRMNVDFGDNAVDAVATNFVSDADVAVPGELTFEAGRIDRDVDPNGGGWTYVAADTGGELALPDGEIYQPIEGSIEGDFNGDAASYAGGIVDLTMANTREGIIGPLVYVDGIFDLERD